MVRLVAMKQKIKIKITYISIPIWCDWWEEENSKQLTLPIFQFLYGAIGGKKLIPPGFVTVTNFNSYMVRLVAIIKKP